MGEYGMDLISIGSRIKAERKKLGLTQEKLSEMVNVTPHFIYEIERGMKAMSMETLILLSEKLELSLDYIVFGVQRTNLGSLYRKLDELSDERRLRAEKVFEELLPNLR